MGSHIFWTFEDGQIGLHLTHVVMMSHIWEEIPHFGQCTHASLRCLMEDVALGLAWTLLREVVHDHSTLDDVSLTLTLGSLKMMSCAMV
jgi:hypothetical protein